MHITPVLILSSVHSNSPRSIFLCLFYAYFGSTKSTYLDVSCMCYFPLEYGCKCWLCAQLTFSNWVIVVVFIAQKMRFSIKDFFSKCDQILRIWSYLRKKKTFLENFIFCVVIDFVFFSRYILVSIIFVWICLKLWKHSDRKSNMSSKYKSQKCFILSQLIFKLSSYTNRDSFRPIPI